MKFYFENARWLFGGFLLACFSGFGQTFYISIWGGEIREEFQLTHGDFGIVYMVATLASALALPFVGRLIDFVSVSVTSIIKDVRRNGDKALLKYEKRFNQNNIIVPTSKQIAKSISFSTLNMYQKTT